VKNWRNSILVAAAAAVAVFVLLFFPDRDDASGAVLGAIGTFMGAALAWVPIATYRPLPHRSSTDHVRLALHTLALGVGLGIANLLINYGLAMWKAAIYEQMVSRWARFSPWSVVIAGPIIEEIAYRLILLGALAWLVARVTDNRRTIAGVALGVSSALFGVAHIFYGGVDHPLYVLGMALKSSGGGLLLGSVFWRRGLPYSIACHSAANATHLFLMPFLFAIP
jgi:membrane protease YdiL (CAAX protease family)